MEESTLYPKVVLEHYRQPRNRGALPACTHAADGANPLCGDALRIEACCAAGRVTELRFTGEACAIAIATASMLSECAAGRTPAELTRLAARFEHLLECGADDAELGPLVALRALHGHPLRRQCALLPWATLCAALAGEARATTATESS
jgi:nitrogen fixation NifU-like protein